MRNNNSFAFEKILRGGVQKYSVIAALCGLFLFASFLFTGCENFLKSQEVKEEIVQAIDYNNAPYYPIAIEAVKGSGTIRTHLSGTALQKVTDTFTVKFEPESGYKFIRWEAVLNELGENESIDDYISFEDATGLETKVTFKKAASNILIRPVCPQILTVSIDTSEAEIYTRDHTIQLTFNQPIAEECKDKIAIKIPDIPEGKTGLDYFKTPVLSGNTISLFANVSENDYSTLIPVGVNSKTISVVLKASDFYYENKDYSTTEKIYLANDIVFNYTVSADTSKKTKIKYTLSNNSGSVGRFRVNEENLEDRTESYSIGKVINLKYTLDSYEDYAFKGWAFAYATDSQAAFTSVSLQELTGFVGLDDAATQSPFAYDSLTHTAQATLTIYNFKDGVISVSPVVGAINKTQIKTIVDSSVSEAGELKVNGSVAQDNIVEYRPGQTLVLKYKLTKSDDYRFLGWSVKRELTGAGNTQPQVYSQSDFTEENLANFKLSAVYEDNADTFGYDSLSHNAQLTICVNEYIDGDITISPVVVEIPKAKVWIDGTNGKLSPAKGEYTARQNGQKNTISFEPDGDYEFVHWQVYNKNNGNPLIYSDYISIDVNKSETTYEILNIPTTASNIQIALRPVVTERPKIISATPSYDAQGAFRDARIQVMFDRPMDEKSIYFTDEELPDLIASIPATDFLPPYDENDPAKKYYGYKKDGNIIFKNITIIDNKNLTTNLLQYFDAPRFDDSRRLSIPTIKGHEPPSGTALLVTLGNNFSYEYQNGTYKKDITMRESYKWVYFVNSKKDSAGPEVAASPDKTEILTVAGDVIPTSSSTKVYLNSEKKIKLRLSAVDTGSGPSDYFDLKLYNANADVTDETVNPISTIPVYYENVAGIYATCGNAIDDVPDSEKEYHECVLTGLPSNDGDYKFTLTFYDKNGNPTLLKDGNTDTPVCYYVSLDTTKPTLTTKSLEACEDTNDSTKTAIKFTYQSNDTDYNGGKIYYRQAVAKNDSAWSDWTQVTANATLVTGTSEHEVTIKGLDYNTDYELKAEIQDNAKNIQPYLFKKKTLPQAFDATKLTLTVDPKTRALKLDSTELPKFEKVNLTYTLSSKKADAEGRDAVGKAAVEKELDKTAFPFVAKYANWGSKYDFTLQTRSYETVEAGYENSGTEYTNENPSITTKSIITKPVGVMFLDSKPTVTTDSISFDLYKGEGSYRFSGLRLYKADYAADGTLGSFTELPVSQIERTAYSKWKIKNLNIQANKRYRIRIVTYYDTKDNVCDDDQIVEFDAALQETVTLVQKPSSSPTVSENGTTATTASFVINNYANSKPGEDFTHYLVEWHYNTLNTYTAKVPKFSESTQTFTATGLLPEKYYTFTFCVCNDYLKGSVTTKYPKTAKLPNYEPPVAPENIWISSVKRNGSSSSSYMYGPDFNYTIPEELGYKYSSSTVQLLQGITYNNITAAVDTSETNEKIPFEGLLPYITGPNYNKASIRHSTSFPGGVKYFQIMFKISDNDIRYSKKFAFDPALSTYSTSGSNSGNSTLIPFQNIQWTSTDNSVTFTWDAGYQFKTVKYRQCGSTDSWASVNNSSYNSSIKTFTVSGLAANTEYDFEFYNTASNAKKGVAIAQTKYAPPTAVTSPRATAKTIDSVTLGWTHATNGQYYNIYQVTSQGNTLVADQVTANSIKITGLSADQTYSFKIASVNEVGEEVYSTVVSQKTDAVTAITSLPQVPITGYTSTNNSLTVKYDVPAFDDINTPDLYSLDLYYKKSSDSDTSSSWNHKSCNVSSSSIPINDLEACTSYDIKLILSKGDLHSDPSCRSCSTEPVGANLSSNDSELKSDRITLKWNNPDGNYYQTRVYYYPVINETYKDTSEYYFDMPILIAVINSTDENPQDTFVLNDVYPNTNYRFYTYTFGDDNLIFTTVRSDWVRGKTEAN
jgi:hypothetical protein